MVKLTQLEYFSTVVESGSINQGAEKLYISQPSLSRAIRSLEYELGVNLFTRTNSGVKITPEGKLLYQQSLDILKRINSLKQIKNQSLQLDNSHQLLVYNIFLDYQLFVKYDENYGLSENSLENLILDIKYKANHIMIGVIDEEALHQLEKEDLHIEIIDSSQPYIHTRKQELTKDNIKSMTYVHLPYDYYIKDHTIINSLELKTLTINSNYILLNYLQHDDYFILGHKWNINVLKKNHIHSYEIDGPTQYFVVVSKNLSNDFYDFIEKTKHYFKKLND